MKYKIGDKVKYSHDTSRWIEGKHMSYNLQGIVVIEEGVISSIDPKTLSYVINGRSYSEDLPGVYTNYVIRKI